MNYRRQDLDCEEHDSAQSVEVFARKILNDDTDITITVTPELLKLAR